MRGWGHAKRSISGRRFEICGGRTRAVAARRGRKTNTDDDNYDDDDDDDECVVPDAAHTTGNAASSISSFFCIELRKRIYVYPDVDVRTRRVDFEVKG